MESRERYGKPDSIAAADIDILTDHVIAAQRIAAQLDEAFLSYLLEMVLLEVASRGSKRPH